MSSSETQRALPPRKNSSPLTTVLGSTTLTSVETSNQDGNPQGGDNSVSSTLSRNTSPLDTLLSMGFARNRAEKALAATGHRGVRIASDWLLAHVNDPLLDVTTPRHYFLYLCPVQGCPLARQLQTFWDASQTQIGWNGAHNCPAHVTLVSGSGMVIPDSQVPQLISAIKKVAEDFSRDLSVLSSSKGNGVSLEKYVSPNYLGLFVGKNEEILLGSFIGALSAELSSLGIPTSGLDGPPKGGSSSPDSSITTASGRQSFHMSLAYQFSSKHYAGLQDLAETLDITSPVDWELRLYSCDAKLAPKEIDVYRVSYAHVPREEDELELMAGDLVYINKDEARMASDPESTHSDGWVVGTSWLTGSTGFLPKNYVERTAQVNACTLHLTIPLNGQESLNKNGSSNLTGQNFMGLRGAPEKQSLLSLSSASSLEERLRETATLLPPPPQQSQEDFPTTPSEISNLDHLDQTSSAQTEQYKEATCDENEFKPSNTSSDICSEQGNPTAVENYGPRQIYVVRHGERVDFTFGTWIPYSFDIKTHEYTRKDLNMPLKENIPLRAGGPEMFAKDCPLTRMGCIQAQLTGEAMRDNGVSISHVYVSPSLRCIQTAHHILQGLGKSTLKMHIEPGLFEWLAWYQDAMPNWMSVADLGAYL